MNIQWAVLLAVLGCLMPSLPFLKAADTPPLPPPTNLRELTPQFQGIELLDRNGDTVLLDQLFRREDNVVFAFFFTQCITLCTATTFAMKSIEAELPENTVLAMISIDPDNDTPEALSRYAEEHRLDAPRWRLLTGSKHAIESTQKAMNSLRGNKMNHNASLFVKKAGTGRYWEISDQFRKIPNMLEQ